MAKNNNLTDFLTDVADSIRKKKGSTGLINPQDFSAEIESIQSVVEKSDVTFYDYEGTILHSYTKEEFLALEDMPELPAREGLTCQGWNYTLEEAVATVTKNGVADIGALYITDDGKTRLYISVTDNLIKEVTLCFEQYVSYDVTVNWGDGTEDTPGPNTKNTMTHQYESLGDYVITLISQNTYTLTLGSTDNTQTVLGTYNAYNTPVRDMLRKVELGANVKLAPIAFRACEQLREITMHNGVEVLSDNIFVECKHLRFIVIPRNDMTDWGNFSHFNLCNRIKGIILPGNATEIPKFFFANTGGLTTLSFPYGIKKIGQGAFQGVYCKDIVIPDGVEELGAGAFQSCPLLESVSLPDSITVFGEYTFRNSNALLSVNIPNKVTSLGYDFQNNHHLAYLFIPPSVVSIGDTAFYYLTGMRCYDFSQHTSVPVLGSSAFSGIQSFCKIVVPDNLYDEWIAATNWSLFSSYIIKDSDFNA